MRRGKMRRAGERILYCAGCWLMTALLKVSVLLQHAGLLCMGFTDMHYTGVNHHGRSDKEVIFHMSSPPIPPFPLGQNSTPGVNTFAHFWAEISGFSGCFCKLDLVTCGGVVLLLKMQTW